MTDAWFPWDSDGTWDAEDWPRPEGPSEWQLFRRQAEPKIVMSDAAARALEAGEQTDSLLVSFQADRMAVDAQLGVWDHVLHALAETEGTCAECREILDVFRRIVESLEEDAE